MKQKIKNWWLEPSPEGVSNKDGFLVMIFGIGSMILLLNLALWLMKPEQAWIGDILFFAK